MTAVPMVKASAPVARMAATRLPESTEPATTTTPFAPKPAPAGSDEVERLGFSCAIGENVDAGAALSREGPALRLDVRRRAAEPGRVVERPAGERQVAG